MVRSCYTVGMVFSPGGPVVPVRWFFAAKGAEPLGFATPFYSRNWEDAASKFDDLGERPGPRKWFNGQRHVLLTGTGPKCATVGLQNGLAPGQTEAKRVTTDGVPVCCLTELGFFLTGDGYGPSPGIAWNAGGGATGQGGAEWNRPVPWHALGGASGLGEATWSQPVPTTWTTDGQAGQGDGSADWIPL